jgi:hypothetical protein
MSKWDLLEDIQRQAGLRLISPFGLDLRLGDVVSVGKDGTFQLEGNAKSLLGVEPGRRRVGKSADFDKSFGKGFSYEFLAASRASTLLPHLPAASAALAVTFDSEKSWILALAGHKLRVLAEVNTLRKPILDAYDQKVWRRNWALITGVHTADQVTLLAAREADTKFSLGLGAKVAETSGLQAWLTSGISIRAANRELTQRICDERSSVACRAVKISDWFLRDPDLITMGVSGDRERDPLKVPDDNFWEDPDEWIHRDVPKFRSGDD